MNRGTLGAAFAADGSNLDLMRLAGAALVLASHSWVLTGHAETEPFAPLLGNYTDGGGLAVAMFFIVSGFLIARSAMVHPVRDYVRARALRIYPAFVVAVLVQTFVVGLAATRLSTAAYLTDGATWDAALRGLAFSPRLGLPGVFEGNPLPLAVNGSLWTLRIEVLCYGGLLGLALLGLLRRGRVLLAVAGGFAALGVTVAARAGLAPPVLGTLRIVSILDCGLHFIVGAALWCYRDQVPRRWWLAGLGVGVLAIGRESWAGPVLFHLVLPYLVLWLALTPPVATGLLRRLGDVSYGTYLYAFPVQQSLLAAFGAEMGPVGLALTALPIAVGCGMLSRWVVERPALQWQRLRVAPGRPAEMGRL